MHKDTYSFEYKGEIIPLNDVGKTSENPIIQEFNSIITDLNLKYSFAKLTHLSDEEWKKYPISLHCKDSVISLKDFIAENNKLAEELKLPDSINGMAGEHLFELFFENISQTCRKEKIAICIETFRLFQDVYNTLAMARFSLLEGYRKLHYCSIIKWEGGGFGQFWIRTSYLNNSIIWYNSCFNILLQTLWISKKYYIDKSANKLKLKFEDLWIKYDDVLTRCREKEIDEQCIIEFMEDSTFKFVRECANKLKHRNGIRYEEFNDCNFSTAVVMDDYNSGTTFSTIIIEKVISELTTYHNKFVVLIDKVKDIVNEEFKNKYNIEI